MLRVPSFARKKGEGLEAVSRAISASQAMIEFDVAGNVLTANGNFLALFGYDLSDVVGKHHRMFVESAEAASEKYRQFWSALAAGKFQAGTFKYVGKRQQIVWIEGSYNPVMGGLRGRPLKVVVITPFGTGLSLFMQWILVPLFVLRLSTKLLQATQCALAGPPSAR